MPEDIFHVRVLASGTLPSSKGTLYTAHGSAPGQRVQVVNMTFVNEDVVPRVMNVWIKSTNGSRLISPKNLNLGVGYKAQEDVPHYLADGDIIEGEAASAGVVSYLIEGSESEPPQPPNLLP